jgi:DNA invertase Pin-like site-specific DNA recombinase
MRAVGYVRVSTEEQAVEGVSLAAQEAKLRAYCGLRGLDLVELVIDAGVSGGKSLEERPGGARLLELVAKRAVGAVIAIKLDRLFRNATDCLIVADGWQRRSVALHLVDLGGQAVDTGSAVGRFFFLMLAGVAEMERNLVRERTRMAMRHQKSLGRRVGQIPYGFKSDGTGGVVPDVAESVVVEKMQALRASGLSIRAVADALTRDGVPARGARWHPTTVARLLGRYSSGPGGDELRLTAGARRSRNHDSVECDSSGAEAGRSTRSCGCRILHVEDDGLGGGVDDE